MVSIAATRNKVLDYRNLGRDTHKQSKERRTSNLGCVDLQQFGACGAGMPCAVTHAQEETMLFTIAVILLVLWLLGLVSGYTLGNFIYVLLVIALVLFVVGLVSGRRTVL